ncbi:MAG: delta-class carbonic anhydrase, partial [Pseudomonadota bacterium]|nr:delta-class carbonic anhydrase [Pseudomonadota bacterium]
AELAPLDQAVCSGKYGSLKPGDTIELHYVHSTAPVKPGPTLGSCLSDKNINPQLRVETQVMVLVNDTAAADFIELTKISQVDGFYQALNIPADTGTPVQYAGSTTGPTYNEVASPVQATWSVRPNVKKVNASSVALWCEANDFDEDHAHGVRNLVINPNLLSPIN